MACAWMCSPSCRLLLLPKEMGICDWPQICCIMKVPSHSPLLCKVLRCSITLLSYIVKVPTNRHLHYKLKRCCITLLDPSCIPQVPTNKSPAVQSPEVQPLCWSAVVICCLICCLICCFTSPHVLTLQATNGPANNSVQEIVLRRLPFMLSVLRY